MISTINSQTMSLSNADCEEEKKEKEFNSHLSF